MRSHAAFSRNVPIEPEQSPFSKARFCVLARPHPDPLPRGEGTAIDWLIQFGCRRPFLRRLVLLARCHTTFRHFRLVHTRRMSPPLLGERGQQLKPLVISNTLLVMPACWSLAEMMPANQARPNSRGAANDSPSPGGEGRDEGGRFSQSDT